MKYLISCKAPTAHAQQEVAGITSIFLKNVLSIYHLGSLKLVMVFAAVLRLNYK